MDKYQFVDNLISQIQEVPVDAIVGSYITIVRGSHHREALCPFHNDKNLGSFKVTPSKGMWYCFTCDLGGDGITFVKEYLKVSYIEAVFRVGLDFGLITQSDYEEYFEGKRYSKQKVEQIIRYFEDTNRKAVNELKGNKADVEILDKVYRIFIEACSLSDAHKSHLIDKRKLSENKIQNEMFFTMPTRHIMKKFNEKIIEAFGNDNVLGTIPGFFKEDKTGKYTFMSVKGIGIPIKNVDGKILGIQVRRDDSVANNRYIWFGSAFANSKEGCSNGTSAGSPIDVIIPTEVRTRTVFVTEGKFKALVLAEETKSIVLSVQGVSTWRGIVSVLESLKNHERANNAFVRGDVYLPLLIMLAYDADIACNIPVFRQFEKLYKELESSNYKVYQLSWDGRVAKGVDDLYNADKQDMIARYRVNEFGTFYNALVKRVMQIHNFEKEKDIPKELMEEYYYDNCINLTPLKKTEF